MPGRLIEGLAALADRYDGFVVDQWGVLHDGVRPYPGVGEALRRLRAAGKRVVVLSNSGKRAQPNIARMAAMGLPCEAFAGVVTSGEACWHDLERRDDPFYSEIGRRCLLISRGGDRSVIEGLDLTPVDRAEAADFLLLTGADEAERPFADYGPVLDAALARRLPLICANPDIVGVSGGRITPSPGALAADYERRGGTVRWIGKPHAEIYRHCRERLGPVGDDRVVAIGDSLEHDIAGGRAAGFATCLIAAGIHADALMPAVQAGDAVELDAALAPLERRFQARPDRVLPVFRW